MLKPLHNGCHNISSLVICFKGVKSILVLCKPETEVFVGSLSVSSVSTSGGLSFLALESAHLEPKRTFARGCFPLTQSQIALRLEGQQQKKGSQRKHESLFTISTVQIKTACLLLSPECGEQVMDGEAALVAGSHPDFSVFRWSWKALRSRALPPKSGPLCSGPG